jgi:hypothetical protein
MEPPADFLALPQPNFESYQDVNLFFSFGGCDNPKAFDFRTMGVGTVLKGNLQVQIVPPNLAATCPDGCPPYSHVFGRVHGHDVATLEGYDIYIKRTGNNEWTIHVATAFDNPDYPVSPTGDSNCFLTDGLFEEYCTCTQVPGRGGKTSYQTQYLFPSFVRGSLNFEIALTK